MLTKIIKHTVVTTVTLFLTYYIRSKKTVFGRFAFNVFRVWWDEVRAHIGHTDCVIFLKIRHVPNCFLRFENTLIRVHSAGLIGPPAFLPLFYTPYSGTPNGYGTSAWDWRKRRWTRVHVFTRTEMWKNPYRNDFVCRNNNNNFNIMHEDRSKNELLLSHISTSKSTTIFRLKKSFYQKEHSITTYFS